MTCSDALVGWWNPDTQQREGGIDFHHAAELAETFTPTKIEQPSGRQCLVIDGVLLNDPLRDADVKGSYRVHDFRDPEHPGSDHKRIGVTVHV